MDVTAKIPNTYSLPPTQIWDGLLLFHMNVFFLNSRNTQNVRVNRLGPDSGQYNTELVITTDTTDN